MREKRKSPVAIAELIATSRGTAPLRARMKDWRLWERWEEMVGAAVAAHARPARWQGKALVVRVDHSSWMQELAFLKPQMTERIQREFPAAGIREIRLELGELPPLPSRRKQGTAHKCRPVQKDEEEFIERAVGEIADPELRAAARDALKVAIVRARPSPGNSG